MHNLFPWFFIPSNGIAGDQTSKRCTIGDRCCSFSFLPWRRSRSPVFSEKNNDNHNVFQTRHDAGIHNNVYQQDAFEVMSKCVKDVLLLQQGRGEHDDDILNLSKGLVSALLLESDCGDRDIDVNAMNTNDSEKMDADIAPTNEQFTENHLDGRVEDRVLILKGIPRRPYYQELSRRILLLHRHYNNNMLDMGIANEKSELMEINYLNHREEEPQLRTFPRPLIAADELGLSEINASSKIHCLPQESITISNCTKWLNMINEEGIRELLGLRTTIGTEIKCFPPDITDLIDAANKPITNKPNAKPPIMTVAGRARAKHSHRGETDQFFGVSRGNNIEKNEAAIAIIMDMIRDAAWINIHVFGTVEAPIMEVRNKMGYGARWSADWNRNNGEWSKPSDVVFRGFLEPQMDEGFEKGWRH